MQGYSDFLMISGMAVCLTLMVLWISGFLPVPVPDDNTTEPSLPPKTLLFREGVLEHASQTARDAFDLHPGLDDWYDLRSRLKNRFPDFPEVMHSGTRGTEVFQARDALDPTTVQMQWRNSLCWVSFQTEATPETATTADDVHASAAQACAPSPAWAVDRDQQIIWSNAAFQSLATSRHSLSGGADGNPFGAVDPDAAPCQIPHSSVTDKTPTWYEVSSSRQGDVVYHHAKDITHQREAETAKRNFVQTLSKTFAHLPIGLVIFDSDNQLALFNPALVDLTGLSPEFLSAQPGIMSFFDQLRENRRMPEPKSYATWRDDITRLIAAANDGRFQETWTLESGQTFRVQGRPHPDGATAFMIEDISAEICMTRNYRAERELEQAVFDSFDEALAVFSDAGVLTFCNDAYRKMWRQNPDIAFADVTLNDAIKLWQENSVAGGPWPEVIQFLTGAPQHRRINVTLSLRDGAILLCTMRAIAGGVRLVRFQQRDITMSRLLVEQDGSRPA